MPGDAEQPTLTIVKDATCLGCGCLCDDIVLSVGDNRIVETYRACDIGSRWFLAPAPRDLTEATLGGKPVSREAAIMEAARILTESQRPIVLGLSGSSIEAQAAAVALADRLGATIDPAHSPGAAPGVAAVQRVGKVGATLGEVRNRADVVVFWGVDPVRTHPRHFERYSVDPIGRFVPHGRAGRVLLVADSSPTGTSSRADQFLEICPDRQFETLRVLRALAKGIDLDDAVVSSATGIDPGALRGWFETLSRARYGAFFYGASLGEGRAGAATIQEALELVRDLNARTRFVALTLGHPGNPSGAEAVLTWQAGSPLSVDFSRGYPRFLPAEASGESRLGRGEADAALIVGERPEGLSSRALEHLGTIPRVVIAPDATSLDPPATVGLAAARTGIEAGGTVMRSDGVSLPLRPALASPWPSERAWLEALLNELGD
jgi:formylmethanofuran dehydrogenase subunit B